MDFVNYLEQLSNKILLIPCLFILLVSIIITIKTRFVQLRTIPFMLKILFSNIFSPTKTSSKDQTISANKALFTAMATTIGISSIVAPAIAIRLGGPGTLVGFMIASLLGGAVTFTEVSLALDYRKKLKDGTIMGGPMQYLNAIHPLFAKWYAYAAFILLVVWSARQANTLADMLNPYHVPDYITGIVLALLVVIALIGGIKKIGDIAQKLVPSMFFLYTGASLWIILCNLSKLPGVFELIFKSALSKEMLLGTGIGGGMLYVIRWGILGGFQNNEAGMGTSAIPHSMAATKNPLTQGILSMVAIYSHGLLCFLSGLVVLLTGTWKNLSIPTGINIVGTSFGYYFSTIGPIVLGFSAILFAYTTILGNSYYGSQCFSFITKNKYTKSYYWLMAILIPLGTIFDVKLIWVITDFFVLAVALPNTIGILILSFRRRDLFKTESLEMNGLDGN